MCMLGQLALMDLVYRLRDVDREDKKPAWARSKSEQCKTHR